MNLLTKSNIVNGNIIQAADVFQIVDAFTYQVAYDLLISGNIAIGSGSTLPNVKLYIAGGNTANAKIEGGVSASSFTGSFLGNGAGITGVVSSSYSVSASYANFAQNAGTASFANNISGTTGFIPVFNSALSLGPSLMFQSGSSIILNNGSGPTQFTFDVGGSGRFTNNLVISGSLLISQSLTITNGNIFLPSTSVTQGAIFQNGALFLHTYASGGFQNGNLFIGSGSGNLTNNGAFNLGLGGNNFSLLSSGSSNIAIGYGAGQLLVNSTANTFLGFFAGSKVVSGNSNTLLGYESGISLTSGIENVVVGAFGGTSITTGIRNTIIGTNAGSSLTTGGNNVILGTQAGLNLGTGNGNIIISSNNDHLSLGVSGGASQNTIIGGTSKNVTSGINNSLFGYAVGSNIDSGSGNTFIGTLAGAGFYSASFNTAIGYGAASIISSSYANSISGSLVTNVTVIVNDVNGNLTNSLTGSNIFVYGLNQNVLLNKVIDNGSKFQISGSQHIIFGSGSSVALQILPDAGTSGGGLAIRSDGGLSFGTNAGIIYTGTIEYMRLPGLGGVAPGRFTPYDSSHGWLFNNTSTPDGGYDNQGVHIKDNETSFAAAVSQSTIIRLQYSASLNGSFRRPYFNIVSDDLPPNSGTGSSFLIRAGNSGLLSPSNVGNAGDLYLGAGNFASASALFNVQGGNLFISGGYGSGTGSSGVINFYTATPLTSSSSIPQTLNLLMSLSGSTVYTYGNQINTGSIQSVHYLGGGTTPSGSIPSGSSIGTGSLITITGSDSAGSITLNTDSIAGPGILFKVNFSTSFIRNPFITITPGGSNTGVLTGIYITKTTSSFTVNQASSSFNTFVTGSSLYNWDYNVIG